jgi:putrescine transport system ATP-binding protein
VRPEKVRIALEQPEHTVNCVDGQVVDVGYLGDVSVYQVRLRGGVVMKATVANLTRMIERPIGTDDPVWLSWPPEAAIVLSR